MTAICQECGTIFAHEGSVACLPRSTKRFCDACLGKHRRARERPSRSGVCPDCGARSSAKGRRCDPCGHAYAGSKKTENAARRQDGERRVAIALLKEWGVRHAGMGPTMAQWDALDYWGYSAARILYLFNGWIAGVEAAGLDPQYVQPRKGSRWRFERNRRMVTGGDLGAKAPNGDAPHLDRSIPLTRAVV